MSEFLPQLVILSIGGSIAPPLLLLTILFLGSREPLPNASARALGYFTNCAAMAQQVPDCQRPRSREYSQDIIGEQG